MEIELISIADLLPYANNARTHSPEQVQQIAASIREFGWTNPVLIDQNNGIIAGHGRALAAEKVGMTEVPCIRLGHLTETQRRAYHWRHEPVMYGWTPGAGHRWHGDRTQDSVWEAKAGVDLEKKLHPTSKPVSIASRPIQNHTKNGEVVYDPFLGSGTTLIAAEQLGRKCYGMEISPAYCDVIVNRWEALTGKKAVKESADQPTDQL